MEAQTLQNNTTKQCSKCYKTKSILDFHKDKYSVDGHTTQCKICRVKKSIEWKENNKQHVKENQDRWYKLNSMKIIQQAKEYNLNHKEEKEEYDRQYRESHKKEKQDRDREYYIKNKERKLKYDKAYEKLKKETDINYRLARILRSRLNKAVHNNQKIGSAISDLGCSIEFLKQHLESKFYINAETNEMMTWENYGEWHIDHIIPLISFKLENRDEFLKACHYTNLQPLWAKENLSKGAKVLDKR